MRSNLPVVLGGSPVREPGSFRTTPEVGERELELISAQVRSGEWSPGGTEGGLRSPFEDRLDEHVKAALGVESARLAAEFAAVHAPGLDVRVVPGVNGTHAIRVAFNSFAKVADRLGLRVPQPGDEVIVPALTWKGSVTPLLARNLVPVLVDVLPGTLTIDPDAARAAITDRTVAIVGVDLFNRMFQRDPLVELARQHGLFLFEDCAQSVGAAYRGRPAGTIGHGGSFSDQGSKALAAQEGSEFIVAAGSLADPVLDQLRDQYASAVTCGRPLGSSVETIADNDRMPAMVASLARAQLERFPEQNQQRLEVFAAFDKRAGELPGITPLDRQPEVDVPPTYKAPFRVDLDQFGGMTLDQVALCLTEELGALVDRIYAPLAGDPARAAGWPNQYDPHSDPSRNISRDYWERIDRRRYDAPEAWRAFNEVIAVEHAAGLDPHFPDAFAAAVHKIHHHSDRLANEVRTS